MACSSCWIGVMLALLGPQDGSTDSLPTELEGDVIATKLEGEALSTRAQKMYERAVEYAAKGQHHDASQYIINAYVQLEDDDRFGPSGMELLREGAQYHLKAYRQTRDDTLLANIQPLLELFIERQAGSDPKLEGLRRDLQSIRELRLSASRRYYEAGRHAKAAIEAYDCYQSLQDSAKGQAIGEQAVLAASRGYRQAWYLDGDIRHVEAASEVIEDHLTRAGRSASLTVVRERRQLKRDLAVARTLEGSSEEGDYRTGMSPRDRSFLIAAGAALGGGVVLSVSAATVGAHAFDRTDLPPAIKGQPEHIGTAMALGALGGVIAGLAIHSMADSGVIPRRERRILAATSTALGIAGLVVGSSLLAYGASREERVVNDRTLAFQNAGFSVLVGMGAPLGAGIAALVSRRAAGR